MKTEKEKCQFCQTQNLFSPDIKDDPADPYELRIINSGIDYCMAVYDSKMKTNNHWVSDGLVETSQALNYCPFCGRKLK